MSSVFIVDVLHCKKSFKKGMSYNKGLDYTNNFDSNMLLALNARFEAIYVVFEPKAKLRS